MFECGAKNENVYKNYEIVRLLPVGPQHKRRHVPIPTTTFLIYPNFASRYAWDRLGTLVSGISECDNAWLFRHVLCVC